MKIYDLVNCPFCDVPFLLLAKGFNRICKNELCDYKSSVFAINNTNSLLHILNQAEIYFTINNTRALVRYYYDEHKVIFRDVLNEQDIATSDDLDYFDWTNSEQLKKKLHLLITFS